MLVDVFKANDKTLESQVTIDQNGTESHRVRQHTGRQAKQKHNDFNSSIRSLKLASVTETAQPQHNNNQVILQSHVDLSYRVNSEQKQLDFPEKRQILQPRFRHQATLPIHSSADRQQNTANQPVRKNTMNYEQFKRIGTRTEAGSRGQRLNPGRLRFMANERGFGDCK